MTIGPYIVLVGNIAAGKTTAVHALAAKLGLRGYDERHERNPFFADFYRDPVRWAFHSQLSFQLLALATQREITERRAGAVQDRMAEEMHAIFSLAHHRAGNVSDRELATLQAVLDVALAGMRAPDLLVHVHAPVTELLARIRARGRAEEAGIDAAYLTELEVGYPSFLAGWRCCPVLSVDTTALDARTDDGQAELLRLVCDALSAADAPAV